MKEGIRAVCLFVCVSVCIMLLIVLSRRVMSLSTVTPVNGWWNPLDNAQWPSLWLCVGSRRIFVRARLRARTSSVSSAFAQDAGKVCALWSETFKWGDMFCGSWGTLSLTAALGSSVRTAQPAAPKVWQHPDADCWLDGWAVGVCAPRVCAAFRWPHGSQLNGR